jgi:hypothetical protein
VSGYKTTEDGYEVNEHGMIVSLGKFEGEPDYVPYLWSFALDGSLETVYEHDQPISIAEVDDDDRAKFPALMGVYAVLLWETEQGFVESREAEDEPTLNRILAVLEESTEDEDEQTEPEDGDLSTGDHYTYFQHGSIVLERARHKYSRAWLQVWYARDRSDKPWYQLGNFGDDHVSAVRAYMEKIEYWPTVWFISDHGNAHVMDLST